jgi:Domain of unknown function (DUF4342)
VKHFDLYSLTVTFIEVSTKEKNILTQTDTNTNPEQKSYTEELQVMGEQLLSKVKELLHEGNVRRIIIKQEGRTIMEFPLTIGVVGVVAAPVLVAIGAISALIAQCSIEVVRSEPFTTSVTEEPPTNL